MQPGPILGDPRRSHGSFNPHPPLRAGATWPDSGGPSAQSWKFQSSPTLAGGCNVSRLLPFYERYQVSILTHPCGRVQLRPGRRPHRRRYVFQSSPTLAGGCNGPPYLFLFPAGIQLFQSSPTLAGGCNGRGRPYSVGNVIWFQSSPTLAGGCNHVVGQKVRHVLSSFNPHPPLRAGATPRVEYVVAELHIVSILTHPCGRVQPAVSPPPCSTPAGFNPHPPLRAGATMHFMRERWSHETFQSSPTLAGGCNAGGAASASTVWFVKFQSSPTLAGGCNVEQQVVTVASDTVSILTHPCGRVQR